MVRLDELKKLHNERVQRKPKSDLESVSIDKEVIMVRTLRNGFRILKNSKPI